MSEEGSSVRPTRFHHQRLFYSNSQDEPADANGGKHCDIDADDDSDKDPDYAVPINYSDSDSDDNGEGGSDRSRDVRNIGNNDRENVGEARESGDQPKRKRAKIEKVGRSVLKGLSWEHHNKALRNKGLAYESAKTKKKMEERKIGAKCKCKNKCFDVVGEEGVQSVFDNFWAIGNYNKQNAYITSRIRMSKPKRIRAVNENNRKVRYEYSVKYKDQEFVVCRIAFPAMHGISVRRIEIHQRRMRSSNTGTPIEDKRGKQPSVNKIVGEKLDIVHEHIGSLPTKSSHYTRCKAPHRKYLEECGTLGELYRKYKIWAGTLHPDVELVKQRFYEKIFTECYNITFKIPLKDTCATCDKANVDIIAKKSKGLNTQKEEDRLKEHKAKAKMVSSTLSSMANNPRPETILESDRVRVVAMDLQQTQPCPRVSTGMAYYLRKLWVYNFCVYDVTKGKATMFMWDEVTGGRGSDEVATCLMKWIDMRQSEGQKFDVLRVFCDNAGGQNKNIHIVLAALRLIHAKKLFRIEFVFMVSGHSYMPCDRSFGVIEKKFRREADYLQTPDSYAELIQKAVIPNNETVRMKREDFLDIKVLLQHVTKRPTTEVNFSKARQLVVTYQYKEGYLLKDDCDFKSDDTAVRSRLMKGVKKYSPKVFNLAEVPLQSKYVTARVLNKVKFDDLTKVIQFLLPAAQNWLRQLLDEQKVLTGNNAPVSTVDDEGVGSDCENDTYDYDPPVRER